MNNIAVTKDSIKEKISLNLLEIDDINSSKLTTPEAPKSLRLPKLPVLKPPKLPAPRPSKPSKLENRPLEPIFKPPEKPIKPMDFSNPDEMQLDLITSLYYRIKAKIFKKNSIKTALLQTYINKP